jgi:hypothetical protein
MLQDAVPVSKDACVGSHLRIKMAIVSSDIGTCLQESNRLLITLLYKILSENGFLNPRSTEPDDAPRR